MAPSWPFGLSDLDAAPPTADTCCNLLLMVTDPAERRKHAARRWLGTQFGRKQATHGIYAEIIVLAVILALEGKRDDTDIVSTVFGALVAVLLAEAYADYLGTMIGTGRRPTWSELQSTLA